MSDELMDDVKAHDEDAMNRQAIVVSPSSSAQVLMPMINLDMAMRRLNEFKEFVKSYMVESEDYGTIPGTQKPTLYKSGAEKLCDIYGLADDYIIESRVEDFQAAPPLFDYTIKCILTDRRNGGFVGAGFGSCNSYEGKYKWRELKRACPICGKETVIKGKKEYGGGWLCWSKQGKSDGCGAKFKDGDEGIESQKVGKEFNDDIATLKNTILKMAKKRAKIDGVIAVTRSSGIFSQDMDDITPNGDTGQGTKESADRVAQSKIRQHQEKQAQVATKVPETGSNSQQQAIVGSIQVSDDGMGTFRLTPSWAITDKEAIKKALVPFGDAMQRVEAVFLPNGKCYIVANKESMFQVTDELHKLGWKIVQSNERTLEKLPPPDDFVNLPIDGVGKVITSKDGKKSFFDVTLGGEVVRCFDKGLQPVFTAELGKEACVKIKPGKGNYGPTLAGALSIGTADLSEFR